MITPSMRHAGVRLNRLERLLLTALRRNRGDEKEQLRLAGRLLAVQDAYERMVGSRNIRVPLPSGTVITNNRIIPESKP